MLGNIEEFMKNITIDNKDFSQYEDEKGRLFVLNTIQLMTRVDYLELSKEEYIKNKFENKIEDLEYNIIKVNRPQSKYFITKKEEDKYTIVNSQVDVRQVWNVTNALGVYKSFTNKENALKLAKEINKKILTALKK